MRNKIIYGVICFLLLLLPFNTFAISSDYKDVVSSITGETIQEDEVVLYLFHGYRLFGVKQFCIDKGEE